MSEEVKVRNEENEEKKEYTPQEYFNEIKGRKHNVTDEDLSKIYDNCLTLLNKYKIKGQVAGMKKLLFHLDCIEKEREIVKMGINTFIYRDDIEEYIDNVASDTVKIIELENYEREIPDEIVKTIEKVKDKFDQLYIIFTDYTGNAERQVAMERRAKDPILFGTFQDTKSRTIVDRFYYLGDWEDEYCSLTLDKMVNEMKEAKKRDIRKTIKTPEDIEELKAQLNSLQSTSNGLFRQETPAKQSIFHRIKSALIK